MGREVTEKKQPIIICRCKDITLEDVERAIEEGITDLETLKRRLGLGMGPCQGRTCIPLVLSIMARKLKKKPEELMIPRVRAPVVPIPVNLLLKSIDTREDKGE